MEFFEDKIAILYNYPSVCMSNLYKILSFWRLV